MTLNKITRIVALVIFLIILISLMFFLNGKISESTLNDVLDLCLPLAGMDLALDQIAKTLRK
ncbi:MAG: hypothetical protein II919_07610 [Lachnospiraceae bacterium]|nr:hypothetical protein [Lachnospiraceae bacterium]